MPIIMSELVSNVIYVVIFLSGVCIGSYLNVCIYRIPLQMPLTKVRSLCSLCPFCQHGLKILDLVPLLSFLFIKGRCRRCGHRISFRYPAVELLTGLLYLAAFHAFGLRTFCFLLCGLFSLLIIISFVDYDKGVIPDRLLICLLALSPFYICALPSRLSPAEHVAGVFAISVPMFLIAWLLGGFGGGDIKLMAISGFMLGARLAVVAASAAILSGAVYCCILLIQRKADCKSQIPFGPYLSIGIVCACLYGTRIIHWYLTL